MVLMALAIVDPNHPRLGLFIASLVLCLPAMLPALPVFYVVLATVWNLTGAGDGGLTWPVTAAYIAAIGLVAVSNVSIVKLVIRQHRQHAS
jgi:hypothetical protein